MRKDNVTIGAIFVLRTHEDCLTKTLENEYKKINRKFLSMEYQTKSSKHF